MQNIFTMIMLVDLSKMKSGFSKLGDKLEKVGAQLGVEIRLQRKRYSTACIGYRMRIGYVQ